MDYQPAAASPIKFAVGSRAFCVWDVDHRRRTREFLRNLNTGYFDYIADTHIQGLEGANSKLASLALRASYSHGLETLMAFLAALVQAPDCVHGWLLKYRPPELDEVVKAITSGSLHLHKLREREISWSRVSACVLASAAFQDQKKKARIVEGFATLWQRLSYDFLDPDSRLEYNSVKHGFRAKAGGVFVAIGQEDVRGQPCPPEKMQSLGGSRFGSSFLRLEKLAESKTNVRVRNLTRNWSPVNCGYGLKLISMSLKNVVGRLQVLLGTQPGTVQFSWPTDQEVFDSPWAESAGPVSASFDLEIDEEKIQPLSNEEILSIYNRTSAADP